MTIFRETYYIYLRNLKIWLSQPIGLIATVVTAVFMFLLFATPLEGLIELPGFPSDNYLAYFTAMILVMTMVFSGSDMAFVVLTDILSGYFDKLLLAPINRFSILLGTLLVAGTRALAQIGAIVVVAYLLGVTFKGGLLGVLAVIVAATLFGVAMACLGIITALKTKNVQVTQNSWLLFMPLAFLSTAFMPKELLTGWFKIAVSINPVDYVMAGIRTVIIQGWEWENILPGLWVLLVMMVVMLTSATWLYRRVTA